MLFILITSMSQLYLGARLFDRNEGKWIGKSWQNPKVSTVILTFDLGETLPACLKSKIIRAILIAKPYC
jgi:hypothetical protein